MFDPPLPEEHQGIVFDDIRKVYERDVVAVQGLTLTVREGEFFSVLGPSGSGKTTALRIIAGFEQPTSGRVLLRGQDVTTTPPARRDVNMVFQAYGLFPHMTVYENIAFGLRVKKVRRTELRRRVSVAVRTVQLQGMERRRPSELSGGQQQRVALARALVNRPAALLLDEPLGALDLKLRREMRLELKAIHAESGTTFIYVTHDQEEALTMSDRIAVMNNGVIEQVATPRELYQNPATSFVAGFIGTANLLDFRCDRIDHGVAMMDLGPGEQILVSLGHHPPGGRARITVRPEKIVIGDSGGTTPSSRVTGKVADVVYLGSFTELIVELTTGEHLTVHTLNDPTTSDAQIGETVVLEWAPHHSFVIGSNDAGVDERSAGASDRRELREENSTRPPEPESEASGDHLPADGDYDNRG